MRNYAYNYKRRKKNSRLKLNKFVNNQNLQGSPKSKLSKNSRSPWML